MKTLLFLDILVFVAVESTCLADTIHVPGDQPTIQAGIDAAQNGDTVLVAPGTYTEHIDFNGKAIILQSSGGSADTMIDGSASGTVVSFQNGEGPGSVLDGFSIAFGYAYAANGGGIYCHLSSPTIINNDIYFNNSFFTGGAGGKGGGIACSGGSPVIMDNNIFSNYVISGGMDQGAGGGIYCESSSAVIENNLIRSNIAQLQGGGICCNNASPSILNNVISDNLADHPTSNFPTREGGGIYCTSSSPVIRGNHIASNVAEDQGGGIYADQSSPTIADNCIFDNSAIGEGSLGDGGGIKAFASSSLIMNNLIVSNQTEVDGGGVHISSGSGTLLINNVIYGNSAMYAGGLFYEYTSPTVTNTILWNNSATVSDPEILGGGGSLAITHCDVKSGWPGTGNINSDPQFVDAANRDFHLTYLSPCRNAGDNAAITEPEDFEGDPRVAFGVVDMGADEFYNHLYCTGDFTPDGSIQGKFVGLPDTWPVGLFIGSGIMDPPLQHGWGAFYLQSPWMLIPLLTIPANGVLVIPGTVPPTPAPYDVPMQALIGWELSNLFVLEVRD